MLFRMLPKPFKSSYKDVTSFRAMLFRMLPKQKENEFPEWMVLELCCFECYQNLQRFIDC